MFYLSCLIFWGGGACGWMECTIILFTYTYTHIIYFFLRIPMSYFKTTGNDLNANHSYSNPIIEKSNSRSTS